jgi:DNA polymerase-1
MEILSNLLARLEQNPLTLACDIETRQGQIACFGIAWSTTDAICVPILSVTRPDGYWSLDDECDIVRAVCAVITHHNARITWQNGLYDLQYIAANWRVIAQVTHDTMLMQHAAFPGLPKGLDFIASMYCRYRRFWKEEGKELAKKMTPEAELENWVYNCKDCVITYECVEPLMMTMAHMNTLHIYEHSMSLYEPVLYMMLNGVRIETSLRATMAGGMIEAGIELDDWLDFVIDRPFNAKSPPQMKQLFYGELRVPVIIDKKTKRPTLGANALEIIYKKHTLLRPIIDRILLRRRVSTFYGTFLRARLDGDNRMRCSYNIVGTETGRFSSSKNAFGRGANLENIPRPPEKHEIEETPLVRIPNVRAMFIPDRGMVIADFDLDRADAHIVAWESNDGSLKELFRSGIDVHEANAQIIGTSRQLAKTFVHGTNYGGSDKTMADHCGITKAAAAHGQHLWFSHHPAIREWHDKVLTELMTHRSITTIFGRVRYYFDRINIQTRNEALAYLGQSPVADVINKGLRNVYVNLPWCQLLLQNHDSIVVQFPADNISKRINDIKRQLLIPIPYPDPLTIPVGCKLSHHSWGQLEEFK